ncbi:cardiolipin synthase [Prolixibacter sp. SD074]|jgi:cardiolipin synthase|uniref:cardiolipin synthase n=1 Tax=Prolixibacter sp. SD074 TaxID=2652391 RepID=UPI001275B11C|nr:cardiolipin synthase [Prolixibacter sp. SD074]GET29945.1 cardiolipin synthase [Prolixibacter sp. SD074]
MTGVIPYLTVLYYLIVIVFFFSILLRNKNPLKTQSYLLLLVLLPILGIIIYLFFGVDTRKRKLFSRKAIADQRLLKEWSRYYTDFLSKNKSDMVELLQDKWRIPFLSWRNSFAPLFLQNTVTILNNGEEKYPVLFEKLLAARHHIHIEYYIITEGKIFDRICEILEQKAREGVEVRLIYDSYGSRKVKNKTLRRLEKAGIQMGEYNPVLFPRFANRLNYRTHRKIVIIDGEVGFTGGINLSDNYVNGKRKWPQRPKMWRDVHCMIEGNACYSLQLLFFLDWYFVRNIALNIGPRYFPVGNSEGTSPTLIVGSEPDSDSPNIMETYFQLISLAQKELFIATPYFIPNESIITALKTTAKSGIRVVLLLPQESDSFFVSAASYTYLGELIKSDVEIHLYQKGMLHSKTIVVDQEVASIGTANMDYRSFDSNAEVNAIIMDEEVAGKIRADFENDLRDSHELSLTEWENRPAFQKLIGSVARLIAPLL